MRFCHRFRYSVYSAKNQLIITKMQQIKKPLLFMTCGVSFIIIGLLLQFFLMNFIIDGQVKRAIVFEDDSEALERWIKPPTLDFKVYFFNVTNPEEVHEGANPVLNEVGPYVYTEYHDKKIIKYHDEDDTVSYNKSKVFHFNQEKSGCNRESDLVTIMNPALMGTILKVQKMFPYGLTYINEAIPYLFPKQNTIFTVASVKEILFDGILINCTHKTGAGRMVCDGMQGRIPITIRKVPDSQNYLFSYFYHKNNSLVGPFRVTRGRKNFKDLGQIKRYQEKSILNVWPENSTCNLIHGTDSTVFPPSLTKNDTIYIFVPDVCGSMAADYHSEIEVKNVNALKFIGSEKNFADPIKYAPNKCHCEEGKSDSIGQLDTEDALSCPKEGAMFLQACYNAPVVFSQPHFYMADNEYTNYVRGLKANKLNHETFLHIEPKTGTPIEGYKRLQMNMYLKQISDITILNNITTGLMPMLWIEEGFKLNEVYMSRLTSFYRLLSFLNVFPFLIIIIGLIISLLSAYFVSNENSFFRNFVSSGNQIKTVQNHVAENGVTLNETGKISQDP